jgi:hypothetical protein
VGKGVPPAGLSMNESKREMLRCIYEQNWQQFRHVENERIGFTAIYCAVASGVLSFLATWSDRGSLAVSVALIAFLLLFTLLGLLISLRLGSGAHRHEGKLEEILEEMRPILGLNEKDVDDWKRIGAPATWEAKEPDWTRRFRLGISLPAFYCLAFFTVLSVLIAVVL